MEPYLSLWCSLHQIMPVKLTSLPKIHLGKNILFYSFLLSLQPHPNVSAKLLLFSLYSIGVSNYYPYYDSHRRPTQHTCSKNDRDGKIFSVFGTKCVLVLFFTLALYWLMTPAFHWFEQRFLGMFSMSSSVSTTS